ncbi:hypothetical protein PFICI_15394 [Pestalotiopsis fici W106-1]|uniref:Uncharacterized protein n=1 Tax=Pestalotiopsis fici (strain W106-1 / CGMCC3.15140) TaxID=1229662 RepID=W3WIB9_PESFW|nr:uncharacterized protein PFICI_15394 [Pestalotiopsis fici W106-1]ETS72887.1 hypothetical protein PFICI_15394 [Pestalotiopsis fici W106-1]
MHVSPGKRRALAPLDNNSRSLIPSLKLSQPPEVKTLASHDVQDPDGSNGGKRKSAAVEDGPDAVKKRQCVAAASMAMTTTDDSPSGPVTRDRDACSISPEPSSIFDNSTGDTSLATCTTEVETDTDVLASSPPRLPRQPTMTRAEARQHAEVLRLRLGLAGYKLRTGQVSDRCC